MKTISATKYRTFDSCPRQYQYKYEFHLMERKSDALEIGSLYHEALELYHQDNEEIADKLIKDNPKHSDMLNHLFNKYKESPVDGVTMETEYRFKIDIEGVEPKLYGFIDRIDEDKGVEYKSSSKKFNEADIDNIQTDIYLYVLLKKFGKPMPIVYSVNNKKTKVLPQMLTVEKTEEEILMLEDKIRKFVADVEESTFEPTPGSACYMCPWGNKGDGTCMDSK